VTQAEARRRKGLRSRSGSFGASTLVRLMLSPNHSLIEDHFQTPTYSVSLKLFSTQSTTPALKSVVTRWHFDRMLSAAEPSQWLDAVRQ